VPMARPIILNPRKRGRFRDPFCGWGRNRFVPGVAWDRIEDTLNYLDSLGFIKGARAAA